MCVGRVGRVGNVVLNVSTCWTCRVGRVGRVGRIGHIGFVGRVGRIGRVSDVLGRVGSVGCVGHLTWQRRLKVSTNTGNFPVCTQVAISVRSQMSVESSCDKAPDLWRTESGLPSLKTGGYIISGQHLLVEASHACDLHSQRPPTSMLCSPLQRARLQQCRVGRV